MVLPFLFVLRCERPSAKPFLPFRMGYTYNGATSVMSSRTKYHGEKQISKPQKPSKQFDKNAYV